MSIYECKNVLSILVGKKEDDITVFYYFFPPFQYLFPWCSGYHISLTRRRSPVRSRTETIFSQTFLTFECNVIVLQKGWWLCLKPETMQIFYPIKNPNQIIILFSWTRQNLSIRVGRFRLFREFGHARGFARFPKTFVCTCELVWI